MVRMRSIVVSDVILMSNLFLVKKQFYGYTDWSSKPRLPYSVRCYNKNIYLVQTNLGCDYGVMNHGLIAFPDKSFESIPSYIISKYLCIFLLSTPCLPRCLSFLFPPPSLSLYIYIYLNQTLYMNK